MKTTLLLTAFICGGITSASAFTVDFTQHLGAVTTLQTGGPAAPVLTPIIINVPGYGDVEFQVTFSGTSGPQAPSPTYSSEVGQEFTNTPSDPINSLNFADETVVAVSFKGNVPMNIDFEFVGVGIGEDFDLGKTDDQNYTISFSSDAGPVNVLFGEDPQAGLRSINFDAVPEPSSALLGALATVVLLRRRR